MEVQIKELWSYISINITKIDWQDLIKDNSTKPTNPSVSSLIFKQFEVILQKIHPSLKFTFLVTDVAGFDLRYNLVLLANLNPNNFPLIETIYQGSKNYSFPKDVQVVKYYFPIQCKFHLLFKGVIIDPTLIKYRIQKVEKKESDVEEKNEGGNKSTEKKDGEKKDGEKKNGEKKDDEEKKDEGKIVEIGIQKIEKEKNVEKREERLNLYFAIDDEFMKKNVQTQKDVDNLNKVFYNFLRDLLGEYGLFKFVGNLTILPETIHNMRCPDKFSSLQYLPGIMEIKKMLPMLKKCETCLLEEINVDLQLVGNQYYCPACISKVL